MSVIKVKIETTSDDGKSTHIIEGNVIHIVQDRAVSPMYNMQGERIGMVPHSNVTLEIRAVQTRNIVVDNTRKDLPTKSRWEGLID